MSTIRIDLDSRGVVTGARVVKRTVKDMNLEVKSAADMSKRLDESFKTLEKSTRSIAKTSLGTVRSIAAMRKDIASLSDALIENSKRTNENSNSNRKYGNQVKKTNDHLAKFSRGLGTTSRAYFRLTAATTSAAGAFGALVFAIGSANAALITYGDQWTLVTNRVRQATQSEQELITVREKLVELSVKNATQLDATASLYQRLSMASDTLGSTTKENLQFTASVSDALRAQGTTAVAAAGSLLQLSQAMGEGTVRAQEFNSIQENTPRILQAMADGLGLSFSEMKNFMRDGLLESKMAFEALLTQKDILEREAAEAQLTVGQSSTSLGTSMTTLLGKFDEGLGLSRDFSKSIQLVAEDLLKMAGSAFEAGKKLRDFLDFSEGPEQKDVAANIQKQIEKYTEIIKNSERAIIKARKENSFLSNSIVEAHTKTAEDAFNKIVGLNKKLSSVVVAGVAGTETAVTAAEKKAREDREAEEAEAARKAAARKETIRKMEQAKAEAHAKKLASRNLNAFKQFLQQQATQAQDAERMKARIIADSRLDPNDLKRELDHLTAEMEEGSLAITLFTDIEKEFKAKGREGAIALVIGMMEELEGTDFLKEFMESSSVELAGDNNAFKAALASRKKALIEAYEEKRRLEKKATRDELAEQRKREKAEKKALRERQKAYEKFYNAVNEEVTSSLSTLLKGGEDGFSNMIDSWKEKLIDFAVQMASQRIIMPVIMDVVGQDGQLPAGQSTSKSTSNLVNSLGSKLGLSATGPMSLSSVLGYGAMGGGLYSLGGAIGLPQGQYSGITASLGGAAGGYAGAAAMGAGLGSVVPVVGTIIGSILGGVVGSLFGSDEPNKLRIGMMDTGFQFNNLTGAFGSTGETTDIHAKIGDAVGQFAWAERKGSGGGQQEAVDAIDQAVGSTLSGWSTLITTTSELLNDEMAEQFKDLDFGFDLTNTFQKMKYGDEQEGIESLLNSLNQDAMQGMGESLNALAQGAVDSLQSDFSELFGVLESNTGEDIKEALANIDFIDITGDVAKELEGFGTSIEEIAAVRKYMQTVQAITGVFDEAVRKGNMTAYESTLDDINKKYNNYTDQLKALGIAVEKTNLESARSLELKKAEADETIRLNNLEIAKLTDRKSFFEEIKTNFDDAASVYRDKLQEEINLKREAADVAQENATAYGDLAKSLTEYQKTITASSGDAITSYSVLGSQFRADASAGTLESMQNLPTSAAEFLTASRAVGNLESFRKDQYSVQVAIAAAKKEAETQADFFTTELDALEEQIKQNEDIIDSMDDVGKTLISMDEAAANYHSAKLALDASNYVGEMARLDGLIATLTAANAGITASGGSAGASIDTSDASGINAIYRSLTGHAADAAGLNYWANEVATKGWSANKLSEAIKAAVDQNPQTQVDWASGKYTEVSDDYIPKFANGGWARGPKTGYLAELHGDELVMNGSQVADVQRAISSGGSDDSAVAARLDRIERVLVQANSYHEDNEANTRRSKDLQNRWDQGGLLVVTS